MVTLRAIDDGEIICKGFSFVFSTLGMLDRIWGCFWWLGQVLCDLLLLLTILSGPDPLY